MIQARAVLLLMTVTIATVLPSDAIKHKNVEWTCFGECFVDPSQSTEETSDIEQLAECTTKCRTPGLQIRNLEESGAGEEYGMFSPELRSYLYVHVKYVNKETREAEHRTFILT
ncbi:unnamed protein product [Owenia fusiformis]|uniref:Uncharacterized protein n=1 Tax=Owenia fusiformis TaxID=6347 RepID=A0A8J1U1N4_OWEFU|nr:unnamed protein product [Owenia fusiformis]